MKFNLLKSIALAGIAAGSLWLVSSAAMAQEVTLRMHQFLPPQANVPKLVLDVWAKRVEEASGGKIKVEHYPSMQLGGTPPQLMDQAIDGTVDIVWTVVG
ncbi:MAG: C4-dicarboxylate ABC transporter, partial [Ottowia sp.]|nr:C4-dicarboxylate ABC transporter [Ottowia sp.]